MADEKKKNAFLENLFGKKHADAVSAEAEKQVSLEKTAEQEAEASNATPENDDRPAWLSDNEADVSQNYDEDISEALAVLFGENDSETDANSGIRDFEELAAAGELDYGIYNTEDATEEVADENVSDDQEQVTAAENEYAEEPHAELDETVYDEVQDEALESDDQPDYEDSYTDSYSDESQVDYYDEETASPAVDEDTEALFAALGYSDPKSASRIKTSGQDHQHNRPSDLSNAYGYDGKEYTDHSQTPAIKSKYERDKAKMILRLGATALFTILLFVYDMFGNKFGGVLDAKVYPVVNIMLSLQLLLITAAFSAKRLLSGANAIFKGILNVYSISTLSVIIALIYSIVVAIAAPESFTLYNFPSAVCLCLCAVHDYFVLEREICVFKRLASWKSVASLEHIDSSSLATELGESRNGSDGDTVGQAFRLRKGVFAENYFRHINRRHPMSKMLAFFVTPVLALALVVFFVSIASDKSFVQAANAFVVISLFSMPSFMLVSMSFPFYRLVTGALGKNAVVFSESDVSEHGRVDTVVLEEADLFDDKSLTINRITFCDKNEMQDVVGIMCAVSAMYNKIGGRIAGAFRSSSTEMDVPADVSVIGVEDGGFDGVADGRYYCVGSDAYLTSKGIPVTRYYDDKYIASNPGGVVLHIAVDGVEVFKLYLNYTISPITYEVINELAAAKIRIVLKTIDPNVNLELISRILSNSFEGRLTLVRKPFDGTAADDHCKGDCVIDGGVIVNGEAPKAILKTVSACRNFDSFSRFNFGVGCAVFGVGILLAFVLWIIGVMVDLPSICVFIFQIISVLPSFFFISVYLNK